MENRESKPGEYFLKIAMAARARGFVVTPLRDKRPFLHAWNRHPLTTETEIGTAAKEYPAFDWHGHSHASNRQVRLPRVAEGRFITLNREDALTELDQKRPYGNRSDTSKPG